MSLVLALLVAAEVTAPPPAATLPQRSLRAARRTGEIRLDGRMDEPAWLAAELGTGFRQTEPDEGQPASAQTRFRVLWDEQFVYVGVECDDPQPPKARLSRRDRWMDADRISFDFDTTLDRRTSYHFQVYASGQQLDALHYNDTEMTTDWDAAWEAAVARHPGGWSLEAKIPLRAMRVPDGAREFGFNLFRYLSRRHEESSWKFVPKGTAGDVSVLGRLTGLDGIKPVRTLELKPYLAGRVTHNLPSAPAAAPFTFDGCAANGFTRRSAAAGCAGLDARIGLTSDLSLVATVNPEFGQVEADERVLNLTTFETFFPEKRPFFLEGMEIFQPPFNLGIGGPYGGNAFQLFYSRRIGRPSVAPSLGEGERVLYMPAAQPVATAFKLSGSAGRSTVGLLSALEPRANAQLSTPGGLSERRIADAQHTAIGRVRTQLGNWGVAGLTATAFDPIFAPGARHAHTGGADLTVFDDHRDWHFYTQAAGSHVSGGPSQVLRDGTVVGPGSTGGAFSAKVQNQGGAHTLLLDVDYLTPQFTVDDLGFMRRANLFRSFAFYRLRDVHPGPRLQNWYFLAGGRHIRNAGMDVPLETDFGMEGGITFNNYWGLVGGFLAGPRGFDDRELRDGTPFERPGGIYAFLNANTDTRRDVSLSFYGSWFRSIGYADGLSTNAGTTLTLQPLPQLEAQIGASVAVSANDTRAIRTASAPGAPDPSATLDPATATRQQRVYLFSPQSSRATSAILRSTWAFSPRLTLQAYAQLFAAGVAYGPVLRAVAQPGRQRIHLADLVAALPEDKPPNPDGRQAGLNVNLILRWEWALGSTLYLVYAHATANSLTPPRRGLDFGEELGGFGAAGAAHGDTFLVKIDLLKAL